MTDIESLLKKMTVEEKAALCTGADPWTTVPIHRLEVPAMMVADGPHGVRKVSDGATLASQSLPATCFPTASCLASTWDRDLLGAMGQALALEAIAQSVDVILGPGVNMKRSPLGGRNFEYFSEDPYLAGEMAACLINGIQSKGVGTSVKHFAANNQEFKRFSINAEIDERALREIYLTVFEIAVKKAKPWTVMCAYNKLNGITCAEHQELLTNILKNEWGFEGLVVSDWGAVQDRVKSLQAGLDLEMPGPRPELVQSVIDAVRSGILDEAILDHSVSRILSVIFKTMETPKGKPFDPESHHALASKIAAEGMVLLKNNGILPIHNCTRIAILGSPAKQPYFQGGGASHINPTKVAIPWEELQQRAPSTHFTYADGYSFDGSAHQALIDEAVEQAKAAEAAVLFIALPPAKESEGYDRMDMDLSPQQIALIKSVTSVQPKTIIVLNNGAPVAMSEWIGDVAAVLEAWMMGQAGGSAIADILFGRINPSGKLAETFPLKLSDTPAHLYWPGEGNQAPYREGLFIGYRYYDAKEAPVLFPFGHGLSYTSFSYSNPRTTATSFRDIDGVTVSVDVTNTGKVAGKEIVQFYVHDQKSALRRPVKELKGFTKVELEPGQTRTVSISLDFRAFAYYHPSFKRWITEDGEFDILVGSSSADIRHRIVVHLFSSSDLPCILDGNLTIREWLEDPQGAVVFEPVLKQIRQQVNTTMGSGEDADESIGMNNMGLIMDMPLYLVLNFFGRSMPMTPKELINDLLANIPERKISLDQS